MTTLHCMYLHCQLQDRQPLRAASLTYLFLPVRPSPRQALGHRPGYVLHPHSFPGHSGPSLRRHLPPRPGRQLQRGVHQVQGGCRCRRRMGKLPRRQCRPDLRCRCSDQRHRHPELQGRRIPRNADLLRQLCSRCTSAPKNNAITLEVHTC